MPNLPNIKEDPDRVSFAPEPDYTRPYSVWDKARDQISQRYAVDLGSPNDWARWQAHEDAVRREEEARREWQNKMARIDLQMFPYVLNDANKAAFGVGTDTLNRRAEGIKQQEAEQAKVSAEEQRVLNILRLMSGG